MIVKFDGVTVGTSTYHYYDGTGYYCGYQAEDRMIKYDSVVSHSSKTLNFEIANNLWYDTYSQSFGIRDIFLIVLKVRNFIQIKEAIHKFLKK